MISIEVESEALQNEIQDYIRHEVPEHRQIYIRNKANLALTLIIQRNPVDTARSRASWVESLEELGGQAPGGWEGPHALFNAISEGRSAGSMQLDHDLETTGITVSSGVSYIGYLEYGTSHMQPFAMVRTALMSIIKG
jgi:hypothetical protein